MAEDYQSRKDLVEFMIPEGWEGMDGVEEGESKDFICTIKQKGDGVACVEMIEGVPIAKPAAALKIEVEAPEAEDTFSREKRYQQMFRKDQYS